MGPEEEKKQALVDTKISGSLPDIDTKIDDKLDLFYGKLSLHEVALLQQFNELTTASVLLHLTGEFGFSLRELGRKLGCDSGYLSKIQRGEREAGEERSRMIKGFALEIIAKKQSANY